MRKLKLFSCFLLVSILIFSFSLPCFGEDTTYVWSNLSNKTAETSTETTTDTLNLESPSAI